MSHKTGARSILYETISFQLTDGIGHLILNKPPSNRMNIRFFDELGQLAEEIRNIPGLKAIVISGSGRHFSSGANLDELLSLVTQGSHGLDNDQQIVLEEFLDKNYHTFLFFENLEIPVISAIRGVCLGSAFEFALFSHFRFCGEDAVLGLPETTYHLIPGIGGISRIAALSGKLNALEVVLKGNTFSALEALEMNLVDRIIPKKKVVRAAIDFARIIMHDYHKGKSKLYLHKMRLQDEPANR